MHESCVYKRKSHMDMYDIYFWTATIHKWNYLLKDDVYKDIVIDSLSFLSKRQCIDVFAFVIMPNHIHLVWRINCLNGKESPQGSFLKYTAHAFKKLLKEAPLVLKTYAVNTENKTYEFWQRDPLAIRLYTEKIMLQKLNYIHANPLSKNWKLADDPCNYPYSSAAYYEMSERNYDFLKDIREEF